MAHENSCRQQSPSGLHLHRAKSLTFTCCVGVQRLERTLKLPVDLRWRTHLLLLVAMTSCQGTFKTPGEATPGSGGSGAGSGGFGPSDCVSTRSTFERAIWNGFMAKNCLSCHTADGVAGDSNAKFILERETYPGFIDANLSAVKSQSRIEIDGQPYLLMKASGQLKKAGLNGEQVVDHGGGAALPKDSPGYQALLAFIGTLRNPDIVCNGASNSLFKGAVTLSPAETLRKAALNLNGRLPTAAEQAAVKDEASLEAAIKQLLEEEAFLARVREMYNDTLLVRKGGGLDGIRKEDFPRIEPYTTDPSQGGIPYDIRARLEAAIVEQPLHHIAFVIRNNRPFTEVVAGKYTVANTYIADALGLVGFAAPTLQNQNEWKEASVVFRRGTPEEAALPHAGALTTPSFLRRWPTTETNKSRARARAVFRSFLATDVFALAIRPVDTAALTSLINAPRNSGACSVCHKTVDPVAGFFRGFDTNSAFYYRPDDKWHDEMFAPGYSGQSMLTQDYPRATQWGGEAIAKDPRFALSVVQVTTEGLFGWHPLTYPRDTSMPSYESLLTAWETQDAFVQQESKAFVDSNFDFKKLVTRLVLSPYFRNKTTIGDDVVRRNLGFGRLLTPEMLSRKIRAVFATHWGDGFDNQGKANDRFLQAYDGLALSYGGIDSNNVTQRQTAVNSVMSAVAGRMANDIACKVTTWEFTKNADVRSLFPLVERKTVPFTKANATAPLVADDAAQAKIKKNIEWLYERVLGESATVNAAEVEALFELYLDVWKTLEAAKPDQGLACGCESDRSQPKPGDYGELQLPIERRIYDDPDFTIRSWQAIVSVLAADHRFLNE